MFALRSAGGRAALSCRNFAKYPRLRPNTFRDPDMDLELGGGYPWNAMPPPISSKDILSFCPLDPLDSKVALETGDVFVGNFGTVSLAYFKRGYLLTTPILSTLFESIQTLDRNRLCPAVALKSMRLHFCNGTDFVALYNEKAGQISDEHHQRTVYFRELYRLAMLVHRIKSPYFPLLRGNVTGAALAMFGLARHAVATETSKFSVPGPEFGFFPDCAASYVLPRLRGHLGMYLALTGETLTGAELVHGGLVKIFSPADRVPEWTKVAMQMVVGDSQMQVDGRIDSFSENPGPDTLAEKMQDINKCFSGSSLEEILFNLLESGLTDTYARMRRMSPLALKVTFRAQKLGARSTLEECLKMEYRIARRFMATEDFYEGVRAKFVDKDNSPRWSPGSLEEVTEEMLDSFFAPLEGEEELNLDEIREDPKNVPFLSEYQNRSFLGNYQEE